MVEAVRRERVFLRRLVHVKGVVSRPVHSPIIMDRIRFAQAGHGLFSLFVQSKSCHGSTRWLTEHSHVEQGGSMIKHSDVAHLESMLFSAMTTREARDT